MAFVEGFTLLEISQALERRDRAAFARMIGGHELDRIVNRLARACFHQIFVTGLFHGDPHPANIIVEPDGGIAFVDFGIFAELDREMRMRFVSYVERVAFGRLDEAFSHLAGLVKPSEGTDRRGFRRAAIAIMQDWYAASRDPRAHVALRLTAHHQGRMLDAMRRHHVRMPPNQLLFWRALAEVDATAHRLPIAFDLLSAMRAFFLESSMAPEARLVALLTPLLEAPSVPTFRQSLDRASRRLTGIAQGDRRLAVDRRGAHRRRSTQDRGVALVVALLVSVALLAGLHGETLLAAPDTGGPALTGAASAGGHVR
jgi:predicted unusual protein kinase regulating ubiquinone biosynthesis (AarF/ABC1/UbiB family)